MELQAKWVASFEDKFIPEPNSGCWLWMAATDQHGYGRFRFGSQKDNTRQMAIAPRFAWRAYRGEFDKDKNVCHHCDNPYCVNPEHLFLGTQVDNMQDCSRKNRTSKGERHSKIQKAHIPKGADHPRFGKPGFVGTKNPRARLDDDKIRAIRADSRTQAAIGADYGIAFQTVSNIKLRKSWAHVA